MLLLIQNSANRFKAKYFFSNRNISGAKTFPFLTNPVTANDATYSYDQGELSNFSGEIKKFLNDGVANHFITISGPGNVNQFANETDRLILPFNFYYSFINQTGLTIANFVLKDNGGNTIKSFSAPVSTSQKVRIDFSDKTITDQLNLVAENKNGDL